MKIPIRSFRKKHFLLLILIISTTIFWRLELIETLTKAFSSNSDAFAIMTPGCNIPAEYSMDESIRTFLDPHPPFRCDPIEYPLVRRSNDRRALWIDKDVAAMRNVAECSYSMILPDRTVTKAKSLVVGEKVFPKSNQVLVTCKTADTNAPIKVTIWISYRHPQLAERKRERNGTHPTSPTFNIHVIVMESTSRLNVLRSMPMTLSILRESEAVELRGYTQLGKDSAVNINAMFSGKAVKDLNITGAVWNEMASHGFFTFASEDWVNRPWDFKFQTVDYDWSGAMRFKRTAGTFNCHQGQMAMEALNDWMETIVETHRNQKDRLFTFTMHVQLTHGGEGPERSRLPERSLPSADGPMSQLFQRMRVAGDLDRSVLFFLGDHGPRRGKLVERRVGRHESRHPFASILFPTWFRIRFPKLFAAAQLNAQRLTTPYDIHATLRHLLHLQTNSTRWRNNGTGISLMTQVPDTRTCESANIGEKFCDCGTSKEVSSNSWEAEDVGRAVVDAINDKLENWHNVCLIYRLDKVIAVEKKVYPNRQVYLIILEVNQKLATFKAIAIRRPPFDLTVEGIERKDTCGKCGFCVESKREISEICVCKSESVEPSPSV